jgi:hypothetical protein
VNAFEDDDWATPLKELDKKLFIVLWGIPGAGKTILASKIGGKSLILYAESGINALHEWPELLANTKTVKYTGLSDIRKAAERHASGQSTFDTLILDTFTSIQDKEMREYMNPNHRKYKAFADRQHPDMPSWSDYGLSKSTWRPIIQFLAAQNDFNVILNCHVQGPGVDKNGNIKPGEVTRPALPQKIWELVNADANVVAYVAVTEDKNTKKLQRVVRVRPTDKVAGKTQIKGMPSVMTDDDFVERILEWQGRSQ